MRRREDDHRCEVRTSSVPTATTSTRRHRLSVPLIGLVVAAVIVGAAVLVPGLTGWRVHVIAFAPLHARWDPRIGPGTLPAILLAVVVFSFAPHAVRRLPWRWLVIVAFVTTVAWFAALALVDGAAGIGHILDTGYEYLRTARAVADRPFAATLDGYIPRIVGGPGKWPVHIAGHPPGALLFYVTLVRLGFTTGLAAGWVTLIVAATAPVAALLSMQTLGAESAARRAAPFLVAGPAAIWSAVSADAVFAAFGAWAVFVLAVAVTRRTRRGTAAFGVVSGALFGWCVMLSYGLPLLAVVAMAVICSRGSWRMLWWVAAGAIVVVAGFALWGFSWWDAYPVLRERYQNGVAHKRPIAYWAWGNLAAFCCSAGLIIGAVTAQVIARIVGPGSRADESPRALFRSPERSVPLLLGAAGITMILLADLSGMSKAEVERIWLPFAPWVLVGTALLPDRWRRTGIGVQLVWALLLQHLLATGW